MDYAVSAYGFLLEDWERRNKRIAWGEFAALIRRNFAATRRTEAILAVIERTGLCLAKTGIGDAELKAVAVEATARKRRGRAAFSAKAVRKSYRSRGQG